MGMCMEVKKDSNSLYTMTTTICEEFYLDKDGHHESPEEDLPNLESTHKQTPDIKISGRTQA